MAARLFLRLIDASLNKVNAAFRCQFVELLNGRHELPDFACCEVVDHREVLVLTLRARDRCGRGQAHSPASYKSSPRCDDQHR